MGFEEAPAAAIGVGGKDGAAAAASAAAAEEQEEEEEEEDKTEQCWCKKVWEKGVPGVQCDGCGMWYHDACVDARYGADAAALAHALGSDEPWFCKRACKSRKHFD